MSRMADRDTLQDTILRELQESAHQVLSDLIDEKLRAQDIKLSKRQITVLTKHVLQGRADTLTIEHGKPNREVELTFTDEDHAIFDQRLDDLLAKVPAMVEDLIEDSAAKVFALMRRRWPKEARQQRKDLEGFRKRLDQRWGVGLDGLRLLTEIARQFGSNLGQNLPQPEKPRSFDVLRRLHARACQIAEEINALLSHGFADGAIARWRTLHEIAAVCYVIRQNGEELAERYIAHDIVETRKGALQFQRYCQRLGQEPLPADELVRIEAAYAAALAKFGREFAAPQGWAAKHLKKANPTIADIREAAKIDHIGPYYRMASTNVHANPKGVFFKLGLLEETDILLAGPSDAGLRDPGFGTAHSLMQISTIMLELNPTFENTIAAKIILALTDEIGAAFAAADSQEPKGASSKSAGDKYDKGPR
jgi:hypothetical protein